MENMSKVILVMLYMPLIFCIYMLIRNEFVFKNHEKISTAIYKYNRERISAHDYTSYIPFSVMESYVETTNRFWDWGYKRIVPKDIYDLIKEYI